MRGVIYVVLVLPNIALKLYANNSCLGLMPASARTFFRFAVSRAFKKAREIPNQLSINSSHIKTIMENMIFVDLGREATKRIGLVNDKGILIALSCFCASVRETQTVVSALFFFFF